MKLLQFFSLTSLINSQSVSEDIRSYEQGDGNIFSGIYLGDIELIRRGIREGGNVNAILDPFLGEVVLKLGKAYIDFPVAPALHVAINLGKKKDLDSAIFLMRMGADINLFQLPSASVDGPEWNLRGFPPAIMYSMGFAGQDPTDSHVALIQRLHQSFPGQFNRSSLQRWLTLTGNPPLLHVPLLTHNFDMLYVLIAEFHESVRAEATRDSKGLTPLHVAAFLNDLPAIAMVHLCTNYFTIILNY